MAEHFNQLTPAEAERLALLLEEMGEAQQIIGKILRHGYESHNPFDDSRATNRQLLTLELGHVTASIRMLGTGGDIKLHQVTTETAQKVLKVKKWMHHQALNCPNCEPCIVGTHMQGCRALEEF